MDLLNYFNNFIATYVRARFGRTERGASLVEYVLLVSLIAVVCIIAIRALGTKASSTFDGVGSSVAG
jgi:pilus assembly protein Flp/PilA